MGYRTTIQRLLNEIADICQKRKNNPNLSSHLKVTIVAVSKEFSAEIINLYLNEVQDLFEVPLIGENKVQEILIKKPNLQQRHSLHFIGHLQKNKVKQVLPHIDYLHSLDSIKLADTLEKELNKSGRQLPVLLQANTVGEKSKFGGNLKETRALLHHCLNLPHLQIQGLMTMAPFTDKEEIIRNSFHTLRQWRDELKEETGVGLNELSMGMSNDYQIALEEGASLIRIGSSIFGKRDYKSVSSL